MTVTSFSYFVLILCGVLFYYILPESLQWIELLILSVIFYCMAATPYTIVYLVVTAIVAWAITNLVEKYRRKGMADMANRLGKPLIAGAIVFFVALWFVLKGNLFLMSAQNLLGGFFPEIASVQLMKFAAALGMGYYTLQTIGYLLDCYWGTVSPQRNILKVFLFIAFFPQLIAGPISRYGQLKDIYEGHRFSYRNLTYGAQRILWGLFKKLVVSGRAALIVDGIWGNLGKYHGFYIWIAILLYPIQMYADFSGCMDIVIGTAELFDIRLAENFNNPFFSRTSQEFWKRWHITLGSWAKDYVLYPFLKSKIMISCGKSLRKSFGKKTGKFLTTAVGMFLLWMVIGVWHGALKYIIGVSLWYFVILMMGELTSPFFSAWTEKLGFRTESFSWRLFQRIRTYVIYAVGAVFFRASGVREGVSFVKWALLSLEKRSWNPWIFFDGSVLETGATYCDINILILSVILMLIVAVLRERYGYARNWIEKQSVIFRWTIWLGMFAVILVYGMYGAGYNAAEFLYQGF